MGDGEDRGARFRHPRGERPLPPQQVQIAALHQPHAGPHQANGPIAQVVGLPARADRDGCVGEQSRRNNAIGFASKAGVERTKRKDKAVTLLARQPIWRPAPPWAGNDTPKA